jgi:hypothetical protein
MYETFQVLNGLRHVIIAAVVEMNLMAQIL